MAEAPARGTRAASLRSAGLAALGLAGATVAMLVIWRPAGLSSFDPPPPPSVRTMIAACAGTVVLTSVLSGPRVRRWDLLVGGSIALGGLAVLVSVPDPAAMAALILLLGGLQAALPAHRSFVLRMRGPAMAALLLGAAWLLVHTSSAGAHRVGALALGLAIAAAAGLVPYLPGLGPDEPTASSWVTWAGFFAPALALALPMRVLPLSSDELTVFSVTLIGLGLVNLAWGTIGAWRAAQEIEAWRDSFLADWGLALVGIGIGVFGAGSTDARAAAYLALLSIVLVRLPLYLWARQVVHVPEEPRVGPASPGLRERWPARAGGSTLNILLGAALSGAAPFAGFPVRLLLLRAATREAWPLAAALLVAMLIWVVHAFRLGRTLGRPSGRPAIGICVTLAVSVVLGLAPGVLLAVARP
jgi:hypothetical protein